MLAQIGAVDGHVLDGGHELAPADLLDGLHSGVELRAICAGRAGQTENNQKEQMEALSRGHAERNESSAGAIPMSSPLGEQVLCRMRAVQPMERGESERVEITISSRFENIELVQVIAEHLCENAGVDEDGSHWIGMAVREAVANAIKHGNKLDVRKKVYATFELTGFDLEITIIDEGEGFDPARVSDPLNPQNLMKTSGRGIFYMKTFMDQVTYSFHPGGGTSLVMTKNLAKGSGIASTKS
ncbi:MAG TPA: ATP-binding protein [Thermoanaerobaculia bacterium]